MARKLLAVVGYETGSARVDMDPALGSLWASSVTTPAPPATKETYSGKHATKGKTWTIPAAFTDADWITVGFYIQFDATLFDHDVFILELVDGNGTAIWTVKLQTGTSKLRLEDASGFFLGDLGPSAGRVFADVWYEFEIKCKPETSSGICQAYTDRTLKIDVTGKDFDPGNNTNEVSVRFFNPELSGLNFYVGSVIVEADD